MIRWIDIRDRKSQSLNRNLYTAIIFIQYTATLHSNRPKLPVLTHAIHSRRFESSRKNGRDKSTVSRLFVHRVQMKKVWHSCCQNNYANVVCPRLSAEWNVRELRTQFCSNTVSLLFEIYYKVFRNLINIDHCSTYPSVFDDCSATSYPFACEMIGTRSRSASRSGPGGSWTRARRRSRCRSLW